MPRSDQSSVQVREALHDIYSLGDSALAIDRVYHVKVRLLNNAVQEIGMGKYQVRPQSFSTQKTKLIRCPRAVDALHRCWFRMVRR